MIEQMCRLRCSLVQSMEGVYNMGYAGPQRTKVTTEGGEEKTEGAPADMLRAVGVESPLIVATSS